jgi:ABC-type multidrug transport system ATPase subunit
MAMIIETEGLTNRSGGTQALAGVDFSAESGHVLALLGAEL